MMKFFTLQLKLKTVFHNNIIKLLLIFQFSIPEIKSEIVYFNLTVLTHIKFKLFSYFTDIILLNQRIFENY